MSEWKEVRRSVPACETNLVPDRCIDWYCIIEVQGEKSFTIYKDREADKYPYIVTMRDEIGGGIVGEFEHEEGARRLIEDRVER